MMKCLNSDELSLSESNQFDRTGVMPNSDPCQIITPLVLVGLGLGMGEGLGLGVGLGLGNQIAIFKRGVIIWRSWIAPSVFHSYTSIHDCNKLTNEIIILAITNTTK